MAMHPIIFLWSHPRSMSTAIERIMRERGDLHCLHEPFLRYYYLQRSEKTLRHFDAGDDQPATYEATREMILQLAEQRPVFAKDMSYYIMPELLHDVELFSRIRHCFLIRNPLRAILSYYKLDATIDLKEIGLEAQWLHFQKAQQWALNPVVIAAEEVQAGPQGVMQRFWAALDLEYKAEAFHWQTDQPPADWQYVQGWHQQVSQSNTIQQETAEQQQRAKVEFAAVVQQAPHLQDYLEHHLPAYHALQEQAL